MSFDQEIQSPPEALSGDQPAGDAPASEASETQASTEVLPARLVLKRGGAESDVVFRLQGSVTVGRFDAAVGPIDVDLGSIPEGSYVSRRHAKIVWADGEYRVEDLGSSNGTFLLRPGDSDFARVDATPLTDGDEVAFGSARFVFRLG